ncbi:MAG: thioredoxin [Deltaproteobacteria bacterium]|nr:MAG: thioredoxin [Deltaproteobacteria bacterium]
MKNASVVIALIVGLVLGLIIGRMTVEPGSEVAAAAIGGSGGTGKALKLPQNLPDLKKAAAAARRAPTGNEPIYKVPVGDAYVKGPADAPVTIVEFSDFECPFCGRVEGTLKQIQDTYGDKVRIAFKHNPLPFHKHAYLAAQAAEAAGAQGKFWEYHDKLFQNQKALERSDLERYAEELGLDMAKFKAALDQGTYKKKIDAHQQQARALGASGTPSFFINGRFVRGAQPFPKFKQVIDEELARAEKALSSGVPKAKLYEHLTKDGLTQIKRDQPKTQRPQRPQFAKVYPGNAHTKGAKNPLVTIVEWSDFQCPFCGRVESTLKQIEKEYGDKVQIAFKHQPLSFHQYAHLAAEAAEAAGAQGKFWEYHDKLFQNQRALTRADLERYAQELGLDMAKFKAALDQGTYKKKVDADAAEGMRVGARGTPTFFINGRLLSGAQPYPAFKKIIDEEIAHAQALLKAGTPRAKLYEKLLEENEKKYGKTAPAPSPAAQAPAKVDIEVGKAPVKGPPNAPVTIIEFSDFQCPFCGRVESTLKQLEDKYAGKIRLAFKHQPLPFHQHAFLAAEAAMAAHEQGKFWEYHDKLFQNQRALTRADLERYAKELGLDMDKFRAALDSGKFKSYIQADQALAAKVGANGTPTFFINGRKLVGAQPISSFEAVIDSELKKAKNTAKK